MSNPRILRDRQEEAAAAFRKLTATGEEGSEAILVQTKAAGLYPTAPSAFYACSPVRLDGPETEGAAVAFTVDSSRTIFAYNLGTRVPPAGSKLIAHSCGGRWTFRYDA